MTTTLIDGRTVPSDSEAWKLECLARELLRRPLEARQAWLADFDQRHKNRPSAAEQVRAAVIAVHHHQRAARIEAGHQLRERHIAP
jgi:hypothetical protein